MFYHEQLSNSYNFMINTLQSDFLSFSVARSGFFIWKLYWSYLFKVSYDFVCMYINM